MHAIGNLLNDYYDYRSGVDARTEDDEGRPGRFLVKGILLPKDVLRLVLILSIPLAPMGAFLIWRGGWPVAAIAAAGLFGGYAYTGPPFAFKYRGLGELCIFIVYGPAIVIGAGYMQAHDGDAGNAPLFHPARDADHGHRLGELPAGHRGRQPRESPDAGVCARQEGLSCSFTWR